MKRTLIAPQISLYTRQHHAAFTAYYRKRKFSKYEKASADEFSKICSAILKEIATQIIESRGGVFIKNFGYFFVWRTQRRAPSKHFVGDLYNYHTNHYMYKPVFVPAAGPTNMKFWSMDNKFSRYVKQGIAKKLRGGFKYRGYIYTIGKLLNLN